MRLICLLLLGLAAPLQAKSKPNIILILTDDQGYGDFGHHGNPKIRTPNLDRFAKESLQMERFYVCPVCSPTRAGLMTGRYNYRTGVVDTYIGRSMMFGDEVTLAELMRDNGYRTGIFGKWHLGDCYPMRPSEQGFSESLVLKGGGIGQPSDPPGGESYFNPILQHNNQQKKLQGYCSDLFTNHAIEFFSKSSDQPFLIYLPFNCPHTPLQIAEEYVKPYREMKLSMDQFPKVGFPFQGKFNAEETSKVYGMIENIDQNLGKLFQALRDQKLEQDTIVIFLTDNGPQQPRWNSGLHGRKGSVYEGGIRVPFYIRWPGQIPAGTKSIQPAAGIDLLPTLMELCDLNVPEKLKIDGRSFASVVRDPKQTLPDRPYFVQWHRGDQPELNRACAVVRDRFKLVQPNGVNEAKWDKQPQFELYDLLDDPYESKNLAAIQPDRVKEMEGEYEKWFVDMKSTRNFERPSIHIGSKQEKVTTLTRQDWRGPNASWGPKAIGSWDLFSEQDASYRISARFAPSDSARKIELKLGEASEIVEVPAKSDRVVFDSIPCKHGKVQLSITLLAATEKIGVQFAEVEKVSQK